MRLSSVSALAFAPFIAISSAASASEAVTYAGTLGKASIIVELQAAGKNGAFFGRYAYIIKGIDIPLHGTSVKDGFAIEEEKPCTKELCRTASDDLVDKAPIGAEWSLKPDSSGGLEGTWADKDSGKSLPVKLAKKGTRELQDDVTSVDMLDPSYSPVMQQASAVLTAKDLPYDFLKLDRPLKQGKVVTVGDSAYRMDLDSRAGLDYPTVTRLGDADPAALDRGLTDLRLRWMMGAFGCYSRAYLGYGWSGLDGEGTNGFGDGDAQVTVDYLTPRLMAITESGSQSCGGAHPNNFEEHKLIDAKTGKLLDPKTLVKGWVARDFDGNLVDPAKIADKTTLTWGPDDTLAHYVLDHRDKSDTGSDDDCGIPDLVKTNLGAYFKDGSLVFALVDLPYVNFACGGDLVEVPLRDARPFLTKAGVQYFAEFDK